MASAQSSARSSDRSSDRPPFDSLARTRFLPLVVVGDHGCAPDLGRALLDGGLDVAEVAFRTPAAADALRAMAGVPGLCVGAGTVVTAEQVEQAADRGAEFVVSPGFSPSVVHRAQQLDVPVIPGVATAGEIQQCLELGVDTLKFFPAPYLGGPAVLSALAGPFPQARFLPTGGLTPQSAPDYVAHPSVLAVGGSWVTARDLVDAHRWDDVTRLAREAVELLGARA